MSAARRVLVVPAAGKGRGGGHISRSAALVLGLRSAGIGAFFFLSGERSAEEILAAFPALRPEHLIGDAASTEPWSFIVLDRFRTSGAELRFWAALGPLVGIDEGGAFRDSFDYLLDLLPGLPGRKHPNLLDPGLLPLPSRRRPAFVDPERSLPLRALVSFGAEDPAGLTARAVRSLMDAGGFAVDALLGPLSRGRGAAGRGATEAAISAAGASVLAAEPNLKERLADYDLLVTSYGLTAFEAARARVPVLLVSPTPYHEKLARARGFLSAGVGRGAAARVGSMLGPERGAMGCRGCDRADTLIRIAERTASAAPREPSEGTAENAAALLAPFIFPGGGRCPLCGTRAAETGSSSLRSLARFVDRTYRRCPSCGMIHMIRVEDPPVVYARDYFFDEYKKQYGRTYLEDFPQLERSGSARLRRIADLLERRRSPRPLPDKGQAEARPRWGRVLDVGCAYGPFLAAARSAGFDAFGVDPAEDAVRFVVEELGIPAAAGAFPGFDPVRAFGGELFDVVTLWYVIEHFPNIGAVLEAASAALKRGGVLAFSTPSGSGISARARLTDFLEKSPADHWTIWEPAATARHLARYGFSLEKINITGHHPERFPGLATSRDGGLARRLTAAASRAFGLGDTFEAYAVKK